MEHGDPMLARFEGVLGVYPLGTGTVGLVLEDAAEAADRRVVVTLGAWGRVVHLRFAADATPGGRRVWRELLNYLQLPEGIDGAAGFGEPFVDSLPQEVFMGFVRLLHAIVSNGINPTKIFQLPDSE